MLLDTWKPHTTSARTLWITTLQKLQLGTFEPMKSQNVERVSFKFSNPKPFDIKISNHQRNNQSKSQPLLPSPPPVNQPIMLREVIKVDNKERHAKRRCVFCFFFQFCFCFEKCQFIANSTANDRQTTKKNTTIDVL